MIYTASFFAPENHVGEVYSIAERQPRGFGLPRLDLFRPGNLLDWWVCPKSIYPCKSAAYGLPPDLYMKQLERRRPYIGMWLRELWSGITLCCWEADPFDCHRKWAAEFLRKRLGCEVTVR